MMIWCNSIQCGIQDNEAKKENIGQTLNSQIAPNVPCGYLDLEEKQLNYLFGINCAMH